jgi:electron transfer flavoprotein alpha subunit
MAGNILVLAEQWRGQLSEITYELLALGRELAGGLGTNLQAVLLGHNAKALAQTLGATDKVLSVDHPALAEPTPEGCAQALAQLVKAQQPQAVLVPLTNISMDLGLLLAARLDAPFVNYCRNVRVADGALEAQCVVYGGKMEATVTAAATPAVIGVLPGARQVDHGRAEKPPVIEDVTVTLPETMKVRFKRYIEPEAGDVDITQQKTLVAVGRGIQTQDNVALAEELAGALGGAVCGSRPVIDQGWLPLSRQVGKSGMQVKPELYLMLGISGAPEHQEGMRNSGLIIAVNTDPAAPIFDIAHYGTTTDLFELIDPLKESIAKRKAAK